jgi:hypothetical protein
MNPPCLGNCAVCLTGHGEFVAAFPIVHELYNGALLALNILNTSNFPAYLLVFLLINMCFTLIYSLPMQVDGGGG